MDGLIAYALAKKYTDKVGQDIISAGFKVQVEEDRSILNRQGAEKVLYLLPKEYSSSQDGYDEFVYANDNWEWVGKTDVSLDYESLSNRPHIKGYKINSYSQVDYNLQGIIRFAKGNFRFVGNEGDVEIKVDETVFKSNINTVIGYIYDFNSFSSSYAESGVFAIINSRLSNIPSLFTNFDISGSSKTYIYHYFQPTTFNGATVPIIRQVIYVDTNGDIRKFIQLENATKNSQDGSYSVSNTNGWVELTCGGSQIVSGVANANGTITFTDSEGGTFNTSGSNIVTSGNEQISVGYDNGGFYFLFDDGQEEVTNGTD